MLMDFQTLNRRELQGLCKLNKIPANITNIAMADALKSLEKVEGIEEFLNPSESETVNLSIQSPERIEVTSTRVPQTSSRTTARKKAKIGVNEVLKTPLVSCTTKKDQEPSSLHDVASQLSECEDTATNFTPTISQVKVAKSRRKLTVRKETITVQTAYSTRRSTRLTAKKSHEVIVLDESDEDSKNEKDVHVDVDRTTVESGEGKVDCCGEVNNLKVKLVEIFGQLDDVDNIKPDSEGICDPSEPSKLDNHNVVEVMNAEGVKENISGNTVDFENPNIQKVSMNLEGQGGEPQESLIEVEGNEEFLNPSMSETGGLSIESPERNEVASPRVLHTNSRTCARKKARIEVNEVLKTCVHKAYTTTTSKKLTVKESEGPDVMEMEKSEPEKIRSCLDEVNVTSEQDLGNNCIKEKHDVVLDESDGNSKIEKVVHVDTTTLESGEKVDCCGEVDNLKLKPVEILEQIENNVNLEGLKSYSEGICNPCEEKQMVIDENIDVNEASNVTVKDHDANPISFDNKNSNEPSKLDNSNNVPEVMAAEGIKENISKNKDDFGEAQESLMEEIGVEQNFKQVNQEGDADDDEVTHESVADNVSFSKENQTSTNANDDVIDHTTLVKEATDVLNNKEKSERKPEVVVVEENENEKECVLDKKANKSLSNNSSLRQLKKLLKATLINSPTPIKMKIEESDVKKPQVVVVEENEENNNEKQGEGDEKANKSLNNTGCSLRQLKKQVKALAEKHNMDAMPTKMTS